MQIIVTITTAILITCILYGIISVINKKDEITSTEQQKEIPKQYHCKAIITNCFGNGKVNTYVAELEVDKDGIPIGYKKIK